ncbi:hypothetical protein EG856_01485 [Mycoplasmopsis phocirhinis]|uniref:DUF31 domain-containing protein n=1 Tax=Mycoplasmopsis phocirhinis TaxID=142650 RepID=A0A4P6MNK9_9BACT|nr:DUF31 family protein [Mycoplasmopsis phocirhinis]QBF34593.1 hypothetical protein EG856_01485 [Mycoplasmopsis phocirhinis]
MKKNKLYLVFSLASISATIPTIAVACAKKENDNIDGGGQNNDKKGTETKKDLSNLDLQAIQALSFDEVFEAKFGRGADTSRSNIDALTLSQNKDLVNLTLKNNLDKNFDFNLIAIDAKFDANITGMASFKVQITNKTDKTKTSLKNYELSGFKTTPMGVDAQGTIPIDTTRNTVTSEYINANQTQRYQIDNEEYLRELKQQYQNRPINEVRDGLNYTPEYAQKFNDLAVEAKIPSYEDGVYKGFTVPKFKPDGAIEGLSINTGTPPTRYSKTDFLGNRNIFQSIGLARLLPNETYRDIAYQTMSVSFSYFDDFASEIEELKSNIAKMKEWQAAQNNQRLAEYIEALANVEREKILDLQFQLKQQLEDPRTAEIDKEGIKKRFEADIAQINNTINTEIKTLTFEKVIQSWEKQIQDYETQKSSGKKLRASSGTMWIMDYEISKDGKYPTKWYFGTNSHVARIFHRQGFNGLSITVLQSTPGVGLNTKLKITGFDPHFYTYSFNGDKVKEAVTRIYDATDYLNTSPKQYLDEKGKKEYADVEEMIDFAVIEVDFSKFNSIDKNKFSLQNDRKDKEDEFLNSINGKDFGEEIAKAVTNNYANWEENKKVKFLSTSYLKDYDQIDFDLVIKKDQTPKKTDELFALGYPKATEDFFLDPITEKDQYEARQSYESLWINSNYEFYNNKAVAEDGPQNISKEKLDKGNYLSYQIGYRSFIDKPGLNDGFIVSPIRGRNIYTTLDENYKSQKYFNSGLQYMLRHFVPIGGSSGSSVRNQENRLVGVHSTIIRDARTDFVAAFRSEGWDYRNAYNGYNLEQYDLIYGGGKNQKTSYRQALEKKYNNTFKTQLFPNGVSQDNIPDEFKFNNQDLLNKKTN